MTSATARIVLVVVTLASLTPIVVAGRWLANARADHDAAQASYQTTVASVDRVTMLRARQQTVAEGEQPEQDVIARVEQALAEAGVPSSHFSGVRPDADAPVPASQGQRITLRRQSVRISLARLTVAELGEFLAAWTGAQKLWSPTRLELIHVQKEVNPPRYDITLLVTATYVSDQS